MENNTSTNIVGMTIQEAEQLLKVPIRVVKKNGKDLMVTMDCLPSRKDVAVDEEGRILYVVDYKDNDLLRILTKLNNVVDGYFD